MLELYHIENGSIDKINLFSLVPALDVPNNRIKSTGPHSFESGGKKWCHIKAGVKYQGIFMW